MVDLTSEFRKIITEIASNTSTLEKEKKKQRNDILPPIKKNAREVQDEFLKEAYRIAFHINNLKTFLLSIRKAYLNTTSRHSKPIYNSFNQSMSNSSNFLTKFDPSTTLTDKERDEIDLHAKIVIQQCLDRIKKLEESEQKRQNSVMNNTWSKILSTAFSIEHDMLAAIRSSITWYLNKRLTEVSKIQKDQQESRIMKEIEKRESTLYKSTSIRPSTPSSFQMIINEEKEISGKNDRELNGSTIEEDDDIEQNLTAEQKMVLEMENETMMKELATALEQVNQAEKALLEISNLQSVLSNHLAVQTQQTDRLYAEAIATTDRVQDGNLMLHQARQRASDTRKGILIFLIIASFILLFLDWYD
ncbi:snare-complex protein syntaxin-18 N-terminus-domain-containing protein [Glomus cerebriforme]|uniref:Snare-complex protein syntaxin-18 N-terminus-domain-containing protein n=1 Tax=Glomus cerebriforme TaxID=658196 RepID=A0A397SUV2_9GLOM|nr:snare-complex protein syntaxin-18 N-terminus-domain-containing protein [Glomus cerebriforme]